MKQIKEAESRIKQFFFCHSAEKPKPHRWSKKDFQSDSAQLGGTEVAAEGHRTPEEGINPASAPASAPMCRQERCQSPAWFSAGSRWAASCQSSKKQSSRWLNEGLRSCSGTPSARRPAPSWNETPLVGRMNFKRVCWTYAHVFILIIHAAQMHN